MQREAAIVGARSKIRQKALAAVGRADPQKLVDKILVDELRARQRASRVASHAVEINIERLAAVAKNKLEATRSSVATIVACHDRRSPRSSAATIALANLLSPKIEQLERLQTNEEVKNLSNKADAASVCQAEICEQVERQTALDDQRKLVRRVRIGARNAVGGQLGNIRIAPFEHVEADFAYKRVDFEREARGLQGRRRQSALTRARARAPNDWPTYTRQVALLALARRTPVEQQRPLDDNAAVRKDAFVEAVDVFESVEDRERWD